MSYIMGSGESSAGASESKMAGGRRLSEMANCD